MGLVFLLDQSGSLIGQWNIQSLLGSQSRISTFSEADTPADAFAAKSDDDEISGLSVAIDRIPEAGRIGAMATSSDGRVILVAIANHLVWITPLGHIAHSVSLPLGDPTVIGSGGHGSIRGLHISSSGEIVVAAVCQCGFVVLKNGKVTLCLTSEANCWAYDDLHELLAVKSYGEDFVALHDASGEIIGRMQVNPDASQILFSECGEVLAVTGEETHAFSLSWSSQTTNAGTPGARVGPQILERRGAPKWTIDLQSEGFLNRTTISTDGMSLLAEFDRFLNVYNHGVRQIRIPCIPEDRNFWGSAIAPDGRLFVAGMSGDRAVGTKFILFDEAGNECWTVDTADQDSCKWDETRQLRKCYAEEIGHCFFTNDLQIVFRTLAYHHCTEKRLANGKTRRRFGFSSTATVHYRGVSKHGKMINEAEAELNWRDLYWSQTLLLPCPDDLETFSEVKSILFGRLLKAGADGLICYDRGGNMLWSAVSGRRVSSLVSSADGSVIAVCSHSEAIAINKSGVILHRCKHDGGHLLTVSADGAFVLLSRGGELRHIAPDGGLICALRVSVRPNPSLTGVV